MYRDRVNVGQKFSGAGPDIRQKECFFAGRKTSDTLVIHPEDVTTDFLAAIYSGKGWDVLSAPRADRDMITAAVQAHERIVMLGHGSPQGLFGSGSFLIDKGLGALLRQKQVAAVWCHADEFVRQHDLRGFYSGMFISEPAEALLYGIYDTDARAIEHSNNLFAAALGRWIDSEDVLEHVLHDYVLAGDPVVAFNRARLYSR